MALFTPDDLGYDESVRQTGFNRYKQLLSFHAGSWLKLNLLTTLGALPLCVGIAVSILSSSVLVLLPCSLLGGAIWGPFLAGMVDAIQRGLRDDPNNWWKNYLKSWRQNGRSGAVSGAVLGLLLGMYTFMVYLLWSARVFPGWGTIALYLFSLLLLTILNTLYWPQLVLFEQTTGTRIRNIILFTSKYLWKVLGVALLQMLWWGVFVLFAPWSLILIPFLGWFILFLGQFLLYDQLNEELNIEELYYPNGSPWVNHLE